jgi:hypothetical protein
MNSFATRFMPSCRLLTTHTSQRTQVFVHGVGLVMLGQQDDRRMRRTLYCALIASTACCTRRRVVAVLRDGRARRRGDLDERELADPCGSSSNRRRDGVMRSTMPLV